MLQILEDVCRETGFHEGAVCSRKRSKALAQARKAVCERMAAHGYTPEQAAWLLNVDKRYASLRMGVPAKAKGRPRKPKHAWSRKHPACIACGKTDTPHSGKGFCRVCWNVEYRKTNALRRKAIRVASALNQPPVPSKRKQAFDMASATDRFGESWWLAMLDPEKLERMLAVKARAKAKGGISR